jgi:hypothetical protein
MCVYIHLPDCEETVYELPSLPNNTASETFLHKPGVLRSVDWIFIIGAPAWRWLGECVTLDRTFYDLPFKQEVVTAPVTSTFPSLLHSSWTPSLEISCIILWINCTILIIICSNNNNNNNATINNNYGRLQNPLSPTGTRKNFFQIYR